MSERMSADASSAFVRANPFNSSNREENSKPLPIQEDEDTDSRRRQLDVIIVGAGLSGLYAAFCLKKRMATSNFAILEAKERVGGRTLTVPMKAAEAIDYWDLGGQFLPESKEFNMLLNELQLETFPERKTVGTQWVQLGSEDIRPINDLESVSFSGASLIEAFDFRSAIKNLRSLTKRVPLERPFQSEEASTWDNTTAEQLIADISYTQYAREAFDVLCIMYYGVRSSSLSALFFLYHCASVGVDAYMAPLINKEPGTSVKGGMQLVSRKLLSAIGVKTLNLVNPVWKITQDDVGVEVHTRSGEVFAAKYVIIAIPPDQAHRLEYDPPLSEGKRLFLSNYLPAPLVKAVLTYRERFWENHESNGRIIASGWSADPSLVHPIAYCLDGTTAKENPALICFLNPEWANDTPQHRRDAVVTDLQRYFGHEARNYLEYKDKTWFDELYTSGTNAHVPPSGMQYFLRNCRDPVGRIHWAGAETAVQFGSVHGALEAGRRAAMEVMYRLEQSLTTHDDLRGTVYASDYATPGVSRRHYKPLRMFLGKQLDALKCDLERVKAWHSVRESTAKEPRPSSI